MMMPYFSIRKRLACKLSENTHAELLVQLSLTDKSKISSIDDM